VQQRYDADVSSDTVKIVPSDPAWREKFSQGAAKVRAALGDRVRGIEHIGSTSVPGLAAKPVVDMLVGLASMDEVLAAPAVLATDGWEFPAEINDALDDRRFGKFVRGDERTHHVHIVVFEGDEWKRLVAFRDALRADRLLAYRYEEMKRVLAAKYADEREKYTAAKTDFIKEVLRAKGAPPPR
jgi:GrpB-like predicted nucleotidyltransferase (UPF0157 family)